MRNQSCDPQKKYRRERLKEIGRTKRVKKLKGRRLIRAKSRNGPKSKKKIIH